MSEKTPKATPEQAEKPDFSTYESTANHFINSYAGTFDNDEERTAFHAEVVETMQGIEAENFDERVKAYEEIIAGLKERANMKAQKNGEPLPFEAPKSSGEDTDTDPSSPATTPDQKPTDDKGEKGESDTDPTESDIDKKFAELQQEIKDRGIWGNAKLAYKSAFKTIFSRLPKKADFDGSPEEYKYARRRALHEKLGATGFVLANVAAVGVMARLGFEAGSGVVNFAESHGWIGDDTQSHGALDPDTVKPNEHQGIRNPWDTDGNGVFSPEEYARYSHHVEDQFLGTSGRHGNDFNNIELSHNQDGSVNMDDLYGQFGEQFRKSPHELASQYDQFHRLGTDLPDDLKELDYKPGETPEQYTERVAELLHGNRELKDKAADFALEQLKGKSLEDLLQDYEAMYIVPDGKGGWLIQTDPSVTSADPHDKILVMGKANGYIEGVRIPCGQPIRIPIEAPQAAPQGIGGAPVAYTGEGGGSVQPVVYTHDLPEGQGGGETPHSPDVPDTHTPTPNPETPTPAPETPLEAKKLEQDIDRNNQVDPQKLMGDQAGTIKPGVEKPATDPPASYAEPAAPSASPDAPAPGTETDPARGSAPAAEAPANGTSGSSAGTVGAPE